jgi:hypothetical protein
MASGGYVRQAPLATEYYERDYDYDEHLSSVLPLLQQQAEEAQKVPPEQRAVLPPPLLLSSADADAPADQSNAWERFFREHPTARFFRERRYFPLAFPLLAQPQNTRRVLEIGAGAGAALFPVLRANAAAEVVATDVSASSLAQLRRCARDVLGGGEEEVSRRVWTAVADGASPDFFEQLAADPASPSVAPGTFDAAILAFTLSAVPPGQPMRTMLRNACRCLKPGTGVLCLRDHALGDLVQLRIPPEQSLLLAADGDGDGGIAEAAVAATAGSPPPPQTYVRGDGTMAHFFRVQELEAVAREVGFEVVEGGEEEAAVGRVRVACVVNRNRRTGQQLRRAFVTATLRRTRDDDDRRA